MKRRMVMRLSAATMLCVSFLFIGSPLAYACTEDYIIAVDVDLPIGPGGQEDEVIIRICDPRP